MERRLVGLHFFHKNKHPRQKTAEGILHENRRILLEPPREESGTFFGHSSIKRKHGDSGQKYIKQQDKIIEQVIDPVE